MTDPDSPKIPESFGDLFDTPLFTFTVGFEEGTVKNFVVHSGIVGELSRKLARQMQGNFEENQTRTARLDNVDVGTFTRFVEYAYTKSYAAPDPDRRIENGGSAMQDGSPIPLKTAPCDDTEEPEVEFSQWKGSKKVKKNRRRDSWGNITEEVYDVIKERQDLAMATFSSKAYPAVNHNRLQSLTDLIRTDSWQEVCLEHANLYVFANYCIAPQVQRATLLRIHAILKTSKTTSQNLAGVLLLIDKVFHADSLPDEDSDGKIEPLKDLLVHYMVTQLNSIGSSELFGEFMSKGGTFVLLFWSQIQRTMLTEP